MDHQLKLIHDKLALLLKRFASLQQENVQLKEALKEAREKSAAQEAGIEKLKQQVDVLRFGNTQMTTEEKKEFEKRINSYLKEIDRCIVMLGQ